MKRFGKVIQVKPEKLDYYKELHANAWPGVLSRIHESNIRNFSIYFRDGLLFSYFEYIGDDFEADMDKIAADPVTQAWWKETDPCQTPVPSAGPDEWWADMEEVFHCD
jgi:L-rhamnose mutarotase